MAPRLEVELPACPVCGKVSKAAADTNYGGRYYCDGPRGELHKRAKMVAMKFREYRPPR